jgi:hypothetical protein
MTEQDNVWLWAKVDYYTYKSMIRQLKGFWEIDFPASCSTPPLREPKAEAAILDGIPSSGASLVRRSLKC